MRVFGLMKRFGVARHGNFAVIAALCSPLLLVGVAGGVDLTSYRNHKGALQNAADGAALAAVREAGLKGWDRKIAQSIAESYVHANILNGTNDSVLFKVKTDVNEKQNLVKVTIEQDHYPYFSEKVLPSPQIKVSAIAASAGQANVCIIAKSTSDKEAIKLDGNGSVRAIDCAAYSNSTDTKGVTAKKDAFLSTSLSCSAGGYSGSTKNFSPMPLTDCPHFNDPLTDRAKLLDATYNQTSCNHKKLKLKGVKQVLYPGNYCGDLEISDGSIAVLRPGVYVIVDGKLKVDKKSALIGQGVGFIFKGKKAKLELKHESSIALSAPESGPMAGILFYAQPAAGRKHEFKIESNDAKQLVGTVYLPADRLKIGADENNDGICDVELDFGSSEAKPVEAEVAGAVSSVCDTSVGVLSAWTAIVVDKLKITNGAQVTINSDYASSTVPVPAGLGPVQGESRLIK